MRSIGLLSDPDQLWLHSVTNILLASPGANRRRSGPQRPEAALAVARSSAGGLPGRYQVGWGEGGVYVRGGCSGAGDSDERDGVGGDPVPVALERDEVVGVELARLQPLD